MPLPEMRVGRFGSEEDDAGDGRDDPGAPLPPVRACLPHDGNGGARGGYKEFF